MGYGDVDLWDTATMSDEIFIKMESGFGTAGTERQHDMSYACVAGDVRCQQQNVDFNTLFRYPRRHNNWLARPALKDCFVDVWS